MSKADRDFIERMIVFENDYIAVLNKPFGIAVQGGTKTVRHIDGLLAGMADRFGGERPRLVHRLDRDTTGILWLPRTARLRRGSAGCSIRARCRKSIGPSCAAYRSRSRARSRRRL